MGRFRWFSAVGIAGALLLAPGLARADDDRVDTGEQAVPLYEQTAEVQVRARAAIARLRGVAEVTGERAVIFRAAPGGRVSLSAIEAAVGGPDAILRHRVRIGPGNTVDIVFRADKVSGADSAAVVAVLAAQSRVASARHVSGSRFRVTTNGGGSLDLFGSVVRPVCRALDNCPAPLVFNDFIADVIWSPAEEESPVAIVAEDSGTP